MFVRTSEIVDWRDLQRCVAQLFQEMGYEVHIEQAITMSRGKKEIDVVVIDPHASVNQCYLIECKYWSDSVHQGVVHELRTVMQDSGANTGFVVSKNGFQSGAREAAQHTNIHLLNFEELQHTFGKQWLRTQWRRIEQIAELVARIHKLDFGNSVPFRLSGFPAQRPHVNPRSLGMFYWWSRDLLCAYRDKRSIAYSDRRIVTVAGFLNEPDKYLQYIDESGKERWPVRPIARGSRLRALSRPTTTYPTLRIFLRNLLEGMEKFGSKYDAFGQEVVAAVRNMSWDERNSVNERSLRAIAEAYPIESLGMVLDKGEYESILKRFIDICGSRL